MSYISKLGHDNVKELPVSCAVRILMEMDFTQCFTGPRVSIFFVTLSCPLFFDQTSRLVCIRRSELYHVFPGYAPISLFSDGLFLSISVKEQVKLHSKELIY